MKRVAAGFVVLVLITAAIFFSVVPRLVDNRLNKTRARTFASQRARDLHRSLNVADLHADSLLWGRDLLARNSRGQVDIPRLIDGNVALQVFSMPTKTPRGLNIQRNTGDSDQIFWLALAQRWPISAWNSLTERALYQAGRLQNMAERSQGRFVLIRSSQDLSLYLQRRQNDKAITAGILSIEGAHALDGRLDNLARLYDAGYRMISVAHFFDNEFGGSSAGVKKDGLTEKGRELIAQMERKRIIVDLAHSSNQTIDDVLAIASRAVVVSHTGVKGTCDNNRNLSDAQIRAIAQRGGIIGIGYWSTATCGRDAHAIARALKHAGAVGGVEHIALGSDFDGAIEAPFDAEGVVHVTDALLNEGFTEREIRLVMGENVLRFMRENLP
jgi:microsomal dipeptidase-like Zn-dependent dipeptidase